MRNFILFFSLVFIASEYSSQNNDFERCATTSYMQAKHNHDPISKIAHQKFVQRVVKSESEIEQQSKATKFIPVVVHVVYANNSENVSDAQVQSQIDVLNEDFTLTNTDFSSVPSVFQQVAGNPDIQFCLASVDPDGNPTNGINRVQTSVSSFGLNDNVKFTQTGGANAWDPTKYFNIWVCDIAGGTLGYAEFPTGSVSNTWGAVISYRYFGRGGSAQAPFNLGRTATHEVGHALGLYHIWGNGFCGDDLISDTPPQQSQSNGCPSFPKNAFNSCGSDASGEMFMNYMDYSFDACLNMFSQGQSNRMNSVLNQFPYNGLLNSTACGSNPGSGSGSGTTSGYDLSITEITSPSGTYCSGQIQPSVTISNLGTQSATDFQVGYKVDNGTEQIVQVSGTLSIGQSGALDLPVINVSSGNHSFTARVIAASGIQDINQSNDEKNIAFTVQGLGASLPFTEGFEGFSFPANGWSIENQDGQKTWERTQVGRQSQASAYVNNYDYQVQSAQQDGLVTPLLNLTTAINPKLEFDLAYQMYSEDGQFYTDEFQVLLSTDCGATWQTLYQANGSDLITTAIAGSQSSFAPLADADWNRLTIDLSAYDNNNAVQIKFVNIAQYANNLYLDNVNITSAINDNITTGIDLVSDENIRIYPNPFNQFIQIETPNQISELEIYNALGRLVYKRGANQSNVIDVKELSSGVYVVRLVSADGMIYSKKLTKL